MRTVPGIVLSHVGDVQEASESAYSSHPHYSTGWEAHHHASSRVNLFDILRCKEVMQQQVNPDDDGNAGTILLLLLLLLLLPSSFLGCLLTSPALGLTLPFSRRMAGRSGGGEEKSCSGEGCEACKGARRQRGKREERDVCV